MQPGNNSLTGDIAEVKIYNSPLPDSERIAEENALKCKYGLGGTVPATPISLTAIIENRQVSLTWAPTAGADSYTLWRATNSAGPFSLHASGLTSSSFIDKLAVSGMTNYYKVAAVDGCGASVNSSAVSVFLAQPALGFTFNKGSLIFSWPAWANDWWLWSTTNLTPPTVWLPVTNSVSSNNNQFTLTMPAGSDTRFFRLISP